MVAGVLRFGGGPARSGAVAVLPRREATDVTTVDGDSHHIVVYALVDLDPEPDPVRTAAPSSGPGCATNSPSTSGVSLTLT